MMNDPTKSEAIFSLLALLDTAVCFAKEPLIFADIASRLLPFRHPDHQSSRVVPTADGIVQFVSRLTHMQ